MPRYAVQTSLIIVLVALLPAGLMAAGPLEMEAGPRYELAQSGHMNLETAVKHVRRRTGGRILSARTVQRRGHEIHIIKVLMPSGRVRVVRIRADTGEVLGQRRPH